MRGEHARLSSIAAEQQAGAKSLVIERPTQMQTAGADTRVVIRLEGFSPSVLTVDADTPQRLFIVLNGEPVSLDSFHLDVELPATFRPDLANNVGAITSRPGVLAARGGAIGATVQQRSRRNAARSTPARTTPTRFGASSRATLGSVVQGTRTVDVGPLVARITAPVRISGSLPSNLLKPGLNTLTAVVAAGPGQRVSDTVGFLLAQAPAKPDLGARVPPPRGLKGLPKAVIGALSKGVMLPAERKRLAKQLETAHPRAPIKPLARISARSPLLAERFGLPAPPKIPPRGVLRVALRKEVPQKKGADLA